MATGVGASVGSLTGVNPLVSLERLFARKRSVAKSTPDWTARLGALFDQCRDFFQLWPAPLLQVFYGVHFELLIELWFPELVANWLDLRRWTISLLLEDAACPRCFFGRVSLLTLSDGLPNDE